MEENLFENFDFDLLLLIKTLYDRTGVWYRTDLMQYDGYSEVYWEIYQDILQNQCYDEVYEDCDERGFQHRQVQPVIQVFVVEAQLVGILAP